MTDDRHRAREAWERYEPVHDVAYFSPHVLDRARDLGYRGFWMGYFAMRSAPLGAVAPEVVTASFFGFHPARVRRALPDAWSYAGPAAALAARSEGAAAAITALGVDPAVVTRAADALWDVAAGLDTAGRPLAAANQALTRPDDPAAALWQATATVREHRGDGHNAVLVARGIGPVEAHRLKVAAGESAADALRSGRGVPDAEWDAAGEALQHRGWLAEDGTLTDTGRRARQDVEDATDDAAAPHWRDAPATLLDDLGVLAAAVWDAGLLPEPNPVGLVRTGGRAAP